MSVMEFAPEGVPAAAFVDPEAHLEKAQGFVRQISESPLERVIGTLKFQDQLIPIQDMVRDTRRIELQTRYFDRVHRPAPCVLRSGELVPVDLFDHAPEEAPLASSTLDSIVKNTDDLSVVVNDLRNEGFEVVEAAPREVQQSFFARAGKFISARISGHLSPEEAYAAAGFRDTRTEAPPGLRLMIRVETDTAGLRIYSSPAYLQTGKTVFGEPSTPVDSYMSPGIYVFGSGNGTTKQWDEDEFTVPPTKRVYLRH